MFEDDSGILKIINNIIKLVLELVAGLGLRTMFTGVLECGREVVLVGATANASTKAIRKEISNITINMIIIIHSQLYFHTC